MSRQLFWCPVNFAEGRNLPALHRVEEALLAGSARLADWSYDVDHCRSVFSLIGTGPELLEALLVAGRLLTELADFEGYLGVHPAFGLMDVVPFVPVLDSTQAEAVALAEQACSLFATELGIAGFLYGWAAHKPEREQLPDLRNELARLACHHATLVSQADCPLASPNAEYGVVCVGARSALIAYNVLLEGPLAGAKNIASRVREAQGGFQGVRALGLELESRGLVQVSMNVYRPELVSLTELFDTISEEAQRQGLSVIGSELIGLVERRYLPKKPVTRLKLLHFREQQILEYWLEGSD